MMENIYQEDYFELLAFVREKLDSSSLDDTCKTIYYRYINMIEDELKENGEIDNYCRAIDKLYNILSEINSLEKTIDSDEALNEFINDVDKSIDNIYGKQAIENNLNIAKIKKSIKAIREKIKLSKQGVKEGRAKILAYLLTITLLIGLPVNAFLKIKRRNDYEVVYPTKKITYSSVNNQEDNPKYYYGMPVVGSILTFNTDYENFHYVGEDGYILDNEGYHNVYYEIIVKSPWIRRNNEVIRKVSVTTIPYNLLGNIVNMNNIDNLINEYGAVTFDEVKLANNVSRSDRAFYSKEGNEDKNIYEVIKYTQDLNQPVTKYLAKDYTDLMLILLGELIVWVGILGITNMTILEGVINTLCDIRNNKKLTTQEQAKLDYLYRKYNKLKKRQKIKK